VLPDLGALKISGLRRRDVQSLVDRLVASGLSGSTVRNVVMPLRVVCRRAIERDDLALNPTQNLRLPEAARCRERVASPDEAVQLLAALPEHDRPV
jgi:site-specific recombinase XerC